MESSEHFPATTVDTPWAKLATSGAAAYKRATGRHFDVWLLGTVARAPCRTDEAMDPVIWGFARKTWARMRSTCQLCGKPGRVRSGQAGTVVVRCAPCNLPSAYTAQLQSVLNGPSGMPGQEKPVWMEHEFPPLIRAALPAHCWHQTSLPDGQTIRYVTAADLLAVTPWLARIGTFLQERLPGSGETGQVVDRSA